MQMIVPVVMCVALGALYAIVVVVQYRSTSASCPHCHRSIPKVAFTQHVPCPECGTQLAQTCMLLADQENAHCRICNYEGTCVILWDNQTYCQRCITTQSPALFEMSNSKILSEEPPFSLRSFLLRISLLYLSGPLFLATAVAIVLASYGKWNSILPVYGIFLFVTSPVVSLFIAATVTAMWLNRPKTLVWNGKLVIRVGTNLFTAPLSECSWRIGRISQITVWRFAFVLPGEAILIEFPGLQPGERLRTAVGFTSVTAEQWTSFLVLANVKRIGNKQVAGVLRSLA